MITLFVTQLIWLGIYVQNPFWPPLIANLIYLTNVPLPIHTLVTFPISIHYIVHDLKRGIQPKCQKLLDLEIVRCLLVLILNFFDDTILRTTLSGHCMAILFGMLLNRFNSKYTRHYIFVLNIFWMCVIGIVFFPNLTNIGPGVVLAWFNNEIHFELYNRQQPFQV